MAILRYILSALLALMLTGCYEDFNPEVESAPVLCINSLITAEEPIVVDVTRTWMYNDEESERNHEVTDASITLFANGKVVSLNYLPQQGDIIRILAESPIYGTACAEVIVPYVNPIVNVRVSPAVTDILKVEENSYGGTTTAEVRFNLNIEMEVNDIAGMDNYYQFGYDWFGATVENYPDGTPTDKGILSVGKFEYNAEPIFKEHIGSFDVLMGNDQYTDFLFFSDRQFSGKVYTLHLNFTDNSFYIDPQSHDFDEKSTDCGVTLYLVSVSDSYYNWAVYKWNMEEGLTGELSNIGLEESKWGYSNVSTGAGLVAARASTAYTVNLKDFLKDALKQIK